MDFQRILAPSEYAEGDPLPGIGKDVMGRRLPSMLALGLLAGCVAYQPAPVDVGARVAQRAGSTLDPAQARVTAQRIAPDAPSPAGGFDRLTLFAAMLDHDPKVAQARAAIVSAQADARVSRQGPGPTFTLSTEYANDPTTSSPWLLGASVDLPLDRGEQRKARLDRADLAVVIARYDYAETLWSERIALRRALIDGEIARRQVALGTEMQALRDRQIAAMERQAASGEIAGALLSPIRALRAQEARALDDAKGKVLTSQATIAGLLGVPASTLSGFDIAWGDFDAPAADPASAITPDMRLRAISARSDVLRALAAYDQAEADVRLEIAMQYPTISLTPGYTWERGLTKLPLSINLSLPSFDLNRAAIRSALAKRDEAGTAIEAAIASAQGALDAALVERRAAWAALTRLRETELPQTQASADRAQTQLAQGQIARADWADAQLAALSARLGALDALARVQAADAALEDALRRPLEGPEMKIDADKLERGQ